MLLVCTSRQAKVAVVKGDNGQAEYLCPEDPNARSSSEVKVVQVAVCSALAKAPAIVKRIPVFLLFFA